MKPRLSPMKRNIIILLIITLSLSLFSCGKKDTRSDTKKIEDRIELFVSEYNSGDAEGMFSCFDKRTRKTYETIYGIFGKLFALIPYVGQVIDFAEIFALSFTVSDEEILDIAIKEIIMIDSENATVVADMGYKLGYFGFLYLDQNIEVYIPMLKEDGDWFINNITDNISSVNVKDYVKITTTDRNEFTDGISVIGFNKNGKECIGLIKKDGQLIYSSDSPDTLCQPMGKGYSLIVESDCVKIVDAEGAIHNTTDIDSVVATGGGYALVYKEVNKITHIEHLFAIIDGTGKTVLPFVNITDYDDSFKYYYAENGVFIAYNGTKDDSSRFIFFDSTSTNCYSISGSSVSHGGFKDNISYGIGGELITFYENGKSEPLPKSYSLNCDGTFHQIELSRVFDGGAINQTNGGIQIFNGRNECPYENYSSEYIKTICLDNDYALIVLSGVEDTMFFTVVNESGEQMFDPLAFTDDVRISEGIVVYKAAEDEFGAPLYASVDIKGSELISIDQGFSFIGNYSDGIAEVIYVGREYHVDKNGNMVLYELNK